MDPKPLNFERAHYEGDAVSLDHCVFCGRGIFESFYRTNGGLTCDVCVERLKRSLPKDTASVFWTATCVGVFTAAGVSGLYFLLLRSVHSLEGGFGLGFGAIGVGYAVGASMKRKAGGAGGRRYQVMAASLTYIAITLALSANFLGMREVPPWAYPFLVLSPWINLFLGQFQMGLFQLFIAGMGMRWAWAILRPHGVQITGPETFG
jgi:hypothetical protein